MFYTWQQRLSTMAVMTFILLVFVFVTSALGYPPRCGLMYGRPNSAHCRGLLVSHIANGGVAHRFFGISGIERPPEIALTQVNDSLAPSRRVKWNAYERMADGTHSTKDV